MRFLIDTCIWRDLQENRIDYKNKPIGEYAWQLFAFIRSKNHKIILTELFMKELQTHYTIEEINGIILPFFDLIEKIIITKIQSKEAKIIAKQRKIPKGDALYAILARDHKLILITRDNHFKTLEDISKYYKPEDII